MPHYTLLPSFARALYDHQGFASHRDYWIGRGFRPSDRSPSTLFTCRTCGWEVSLPTQEFRSLSALGIANTASLPRALLEDRNNPYHAPGFRFPSAPPGSIAPYAGAPLGETVQTVGEDLNALRERSTYNHAASLFNDLISAADPPHQLALHRHLVSAGILLQGQTIPFLTPLGYDPQYLTHTLLGFLTRFELGLPLEAPPPQETQLLAFQKAADALDLATRRFWERAAPYARTEHLRHLVEDGLRNPHRARDLYRLFGSPPDEAHAKARDRYTRLPIDEESSAEDPNGRTLSDSTPEMSPKNRRYTPTHTDDSPRQLNPFYPQYPDVLLSPSKPKEAPPPVCPSPAGPRLYRRNPNPRRTRHLPLRIYRRARRPTRRQWLLPRRPRRFHYPPPWLRRTTHRRLDQRRMTPPLSLPTPTKASSSPTVPLSSPGTSSTNVPTNTERSSSAISSSSPPVYLSQPQASVGFEPPMQAKSSLSRCPQTALF